MKLGHLIFFAVSGLILARLLLDGDTDKLIAGSVLLCLAGVMIWFNRLWARYFLGFGFIESLASDFSNPERSSAAIAFLGWVLLLLLAVFL